jgi:GNAT superfamily N-acetyltransferase
MLQASDWSEASELICISMNYWDRVHGRPPTFSGPSSTIAFCEIYERLDPGCCFVMEAEPSGRLMGLCFYRERETHMSVGVMAVHPNYFGAGVARRILSAILDIAAERGKPTRLISNAANLDSFSLYTRAGFVPRALFQGVVFRPTSGAPRRPPASTRVRQAVEADLPRIGALEGAVAHIERTKDYRFFLDDHQGIWRLLVHTDDRSELDGYLASSSSKGMSWIGPGAMRSESVAVELLRAQLPTEETEDATAILPVDQPELVRAAYALGGRNIELFMIQVKGAYAGFDGVVIPSGMPESG